MKERNKFSLAQYKNKFIEFIKITDHKILASWSIDCVERVMPYFEKKYPQDQRPRHAIETLQAWIATGKFKMSTIRSASLSSHAAAREIGEDNAARSVARAAGQAVATAHVPTHAIGGAIYALQAIFRANTPTEANLAVEKE
ncbi:MAG: putative immunity protein, partial [Candidatus Riflemargulisbacteria bacterium]